MPTLVARALVRAVLFVAAPLALAAQNRAVGPNSTGPHDAKSVHAIPVPSARAAHRTSPIVIDGKLDDAAWKDATPVTDFTQVDPDEGKPATQKTEMRFLFDDDALYISAKMYDTQGAAGVRTSLVRRDQSFNSDYIEIVIDGFHDHLGRAFFDLNPSGSRQDQLGIGSSCCDSGWDPIWEAATHIDEDGWSAEIRIPLNQLRFPAESLQTWGLELRRFILRNNELDQWAFWRKNESGGPSRFGHLEGLRLPAASRHAEILPYAAAKSKNVAFTPGDPFNNGHVESARFGLDLKYLLSSNLTLDATFNPDFGQVEVDPAVINLSAFETSFPEKRPFFIAGSGVFGFGSLSCFFCSNVSSLSAFYSRRIGRAPTGADLAYARAPYADVPDAADIIGAGKITGRTSDGTTIGLLDAVTGRTSARLQLADGSRATQEVEPLSNYFVGRVKKDLMGGNLVLGGILTSVARQMDTTFAPRLNSHSEFLGADFLYTWKEHTYSWMGQFALTSIEGDPRTIAARQQSSARYFQRPDRPAGSNGFLTDRYDTTASMMRGAGGYMRVAKDAGDWAWESALNFRTPGFENNDLGFLTRADYVWHSANVMRMLTKPTSWYHTFAVIVGGQEQWNFEGDLTDRQLQVWANDQLPSFWTISNFYIWRPALMDDRLLRGGPVVRKPGQGYYELDVSSDSRRAVILNFGGSYAWSQLSGWSTNFYANAQYRPVSSVSLTFGPSWNDSRSDLQYVTSVRDPAATAFYGSRYVVSAIKQKQLALDTRASITFTPTMTFELYAQPFLGSGQYLDYREFASPRNGTTFIFGRDRGTIAPVRDPATGLVSSYTVDPDGTGPAHAFSFANPDFNFRSLRGSALFRWEYHPGSVLYVAWTHQRSDAQSYGDFDFARDREGLLATRPDNIFLVKASWWLAR